VAVGDQRLACLFGQQGRAPPLRILGADRAGADLEQRRTVFLQLSRLTALICVPGYIGVALTSGDLVTLMLDAEYASVALMLAVLAVTGAVFIPLANFRNAILTSLGRMKLLVLVSIADVALVVGSAFAAMPFGLIAVLAAISLQNLSTFLFALRPILREMGTRKREMAMAIVPPFIASGAMAAIVVGVGAVLPKDPLIHLAGEAATGAVIYTGILLAFFRPWTMDVLRGLKSRSAPPSPTAAEALEPA